jgi:hypothetical protein
MWEAFAPEPWEETLLTAKTFLLSLPVKDRQKRICEWFLKLEHEKSPEYASYVLQRIVACDQFSFRFTFRENRQSARVMIDDKTVTLGYHPQGKREQKKVHHWPPGGETKNRLRMPPRFKREDQTETQRKVGKQDAKFRAERSEIENNTFPKIVGQNEKYKKHPVIKAWIEHQLIAVEYRRLAGLPFTDPGIDQARKNLEAVGEGERAKAISEEYENLTVIRAKEREELNNNPFVKGIHAEWWKATKTYPFEEVEERAYLVLCAIANNDRYTDNDRYIRYLLSVFEECFKYRKSERAHFERAKARMLRNSHSEVKASRLSEDRKILRKR